MDPKSDKTTTEDPGMQRKRITERVTEYKVHTYEPSGPTIQSQVGGGLTTSSIHTKIRTGSKGPDLNFQVRGGKYGGNVVGNNTTGRPILNTQPRDIGSASGGHETDDSGDRGRIISGNKTKRGQWDVTGSLAPAPSKANQGGMAHSCPSGSRRKKNSAPTIFRRTYDNSDIPVTLENDVHGTRLKWLEGVSDPGHLDYHYYLPLFCDGLRDTKHPYDVLAECGVRDLLKAAPNKVISVVPQLILPIKEALETHNHGVICRTLRVIQQLVLCESVGLALVPYYRQILPVLNCFKGRNKNLGDQIDYGQQKGANIGDVIDETLCMLETYGGEDAFINIKYMIPTYESCVLN